jgi:hypothetical protein
MIITFSITINRREKVHKLQQQSQKSLAVVSYQCL